MLRVLLVSRCGQEEGREERPHRLVPKLGLMLDCTKFGAAPHAGVRIAAVVAPMFEAAAFTLQRCGAPEFAMWAALIILPGTRMAVVEAASTVVRQASSRHLPIARFAVEDSCA